MEFTFSSDEFSFKPLSQRELEWARLLHNDPEVLNMLTDPTVVSKPQQKAWFEKLSKSSSSKRLVVSKAGEKIGLIRLDAIDLSNKSIMVGLDIEKTYRGKGLAKPIYDALLKFCFKNLKLHRIYLKVADFNTIAKSLYSGIGFKVEGKERDALFRFGKFHDYILMSMLESEYFDQYGKVL